MTEVSDLAQKLVAHGFDRERVKTFAAHVARVEASSGVRVHDWLVNGTAPFPDMPGVQFNNVRGDQLTKLINAAHAEAGLNRNILINGIPVPDHYNVMVLGGG